MKIRDFLPEHAAVLAWILHESVRCLGRNDYSEAQVRAWSPAPVSASAFLSRVSDDRFVYVAVSEDEAPIGFIELEPDGHIDCFYCHPDHAGRGVGSALYQRLEETALSIGLSRLYVEASEAARRFFLGRGFRVVERRNFKRGGVRIHNYLMEKTF